MVDGGAGDLGVSRTPRVDCIFNPQAGAALNIGTGGKCPIRLKTNRAVHRIPKHA